MRKGFTLIELAIALMVIGLILAMAMKGRAVVDSAEIKSDINKVRKVKSAIATYYSKYGEFPGSDERLGTRAIYEDLAEEGLVTESDFYISMENMYMAFAGCSNRMYQNRRDLNSTGVYSRLCMGLSKTETTKNETFTGIINVTTSKFPCYVEQMLDDKNIAAGKGIGAPYYSEVLDFNDSCDDTGRVHTYTYIMY